MENSLESLPRRGKVPNSSASNSLGIVPCMIVPCMIVPCVTVPCMIVPCVAQVDRPATRQTQTIDLGAKGGLSKSLRESRKDNLWGNQRQGKLRSWVDVTRVDRIGECLG